MPAYSENRPYWESSISSSNVRDSYEIISSFCSRPKPPTRKGLTREIHPPLIVAGVPDLHTTDVAWDIQRHTRTDRTEPYENLLNGPGHTPRWRPRSPHSISGRLVSANCGPNLLKGFHVTARISTRCGRVSRSPSDLFFSPPSAFS